MSNPSLSLTIDQALAERRILITCGTGGVGKTTLSAAIAVRATLLGKRTAVITIDPAKRLATSLGLDYLGNKPVDITPLLLKTFQKTGQKTSGNFGTLHAIMPDANRNFEDFLQDLAPSSSIVE